MYSIIESTNTMPASSNSRPKLVAEILPVVVWDEIFNHLKASPKDLVTCCSTNRDWYDILKRRTKLQTFLMADAIRFIGEYLVNPKDILNCRLVCRSWRWSVDNYLVHHPQHFTFGNVLNEDSYPRPLRFGFKLTRNTAEKFQQFLDRQELTKDVYYFPFFSRYICYIESSYSLRPIFFKLLSLYGFEIWHCQLRFDYTYVDSESKYSVVSSCLQLLPNLRSFWLEYFPPWISQRHVMTPSMQKLVSRIPIPNLEHLVALTMLNVTRPLEEHILFPNHNQIRMLRISSKGMYGDHIMFPSSIINTSCSGIYNNISSNSNFSTQLGELNLWYPLKADLDNLRFTLWPIKVLKLDHIRTADLQPVLRATSWFGQTLLYLSISLFYERSKTENYCESMHHKLYLPHLKKFSLIAHRLKLENIDFLGPCVNLETLHLAACRPYYSSDTRMRSRATTLAANGGHMLIQFKGYIGFMYESNIWTLLPHLHKLTIEMKRNGLSRNEPKDSSYVYTKSGLVNFNKYLIYVTSRLG